MLTEKTKSSIGAMSIDDDGTLLYSTGLGHGDALHLGDLDPPVQDLKCLTSMSTIRFQTELNSATPRTERSSGATRTNYRYQAGVCQPILIRAIPARKCGPLDHIGVDSRLRAAVYTVDGTKLSDDIPTPSTSVYGGTATPA